MPWRKVIIVMNGGIMTPNDHYSLSANISGHHLQQKKISINENP